MNKSMMKEEVTKHLTENIIPFWKALRDDTYGGYYGYMDYNLNVDKTAEKGCILNSRITWFFADEPTGALDTASGLAVMKLFQELVYKEGITIVMTTHDPKLMELGDVVYEIEDGEIVER